MSLSFKQWMALEDATVPGTTDFTGTSSVHDQIKTDFKKLHKQPGQMSNVEGIRRSIKGQSIAPKAVATPKRIGK